MALRTYSRGTLYNSMHQMVVDAKLVFYILAQHCLFNVSRYTIFNILKHIIHWKSYPSWKKHNIRFGMVPYHSEITKHGIQEKSNGPQWDMKERALTTRL